MHTPHRSLCWRCKSPALGDPNLPESHQQGLCVTPYKHSQNTWKLTKFIEETVGVFFRRNSALSLDRCHDGLSLFCLFSVYSEATLKSLPSLVSCTGGSILCHLCANNPTLERFVWIFFPSGKRSLCKHTPPFPVSQLPEPGGCWGLLPSSPRSCFSPDVSRDKQLGSGCARVHRS